MKPVTLNHLLKIISQRLEGLFSPEEIHTIKRTIIESALNIPYHNVFLSLNDNVNPSIIESVERILEEIVNGKPLQYAIGYTHFSDLKIKVNPSVLIPRPETEELVSLIVNSNRKQNPKILDIGTGSGCIALSLAKALPNSMVTGIDISEDALTLAKENAISNNLNVSFLLADIFNPQPINALRFDIIVSNPPYVRELEKRYMQSNVLDHEPHLALFVPDKNPMIFYEAIAGFAVDHLTNGGELYLEINEAFGNEVKMLLGGKGFSNIRIQNDFRGRVRFAMANLLR